MSSRSPRGSLSGVSTAAEVAADFEDSLKDLQINNRYEISNLTIIAKENTEHAQAISRALENHIKTTSPSRKLPALYVLDSIVKNVGTPFTVYLGRDLFNTFMDAYRLVDGITRRNMEGMLKTWKEPVPGSIDPHPVFPPETVRPIENALIKARTAALQSQSQRQPPPPYRGTFTPPQHNPQFAPPHPQSMLQQYGQLAVQQQTPQPQQYPYAMMHAQTPAHDTEDIKRDIAALLSRDQAALTANPGDMALRTRYSALSDLQKVLHSQSFSAPELQAIRGQVSQLSNSGPLQPQPTPQPVLSAHQWSPPPQQYNPPQPSFAMGQPPAQPAVPNLTPQALSGLQALLANAPKPSTPQIRAAVPGFQHASHAQLNAIQNHTAAPNTNGTNDLLSSLAKAGLLNPAPPPASAPPSRAPLSAPPPEDPTAALLKSLQSFLPPASQIRTPPPLMQPSVASTAGLPLSLASLKTPRPDLIHSLYEAQPNQCSICGRRFLATEDDRERKSRHLDWHFRTNQRIADPSMNRGHHRNWYADEMAWIKHREFDPSTTTTAAAAAAAQVTEMSAAAVAPKGPQDRFLRAPAGMTKNTCSICFEEMRSSYSEELQDWIFSNATASHGKMVHATCLAEMAGLKPGTPGLGGGGGGGGAGGALAAALAGSATTTTAGRRERSATPDSSLGKRKAETVMAGLGARVRVE